MAGWKRRTVVVVRAGGEAGASGAGPVCSAGSGWWGGKGSKGFAQPALQAITPAGREEPAAARSGRCLRPHGQYRHLQVHLASLQGWIGCDVDHLCSCGGERQAASDQPGLAHRQHAFTAEQGERWGRGSHGAAAHGGLLWRGRLWRGVGGPLEQARPGSVRDRIAAAGGEGDWQPNRAAQGEASATPGPWRSIASIP